MATKLDKTVTREVEIRGVRVNASLTIDGTVEFQIVGRKFTVSKSLEEIFDEQAAQITDKTAIKSYRDAGLL